MENNGKQEARLKPYLSPVGAWALSLGTAIGWGAVSVNGIGLAGGLPGLIIGALIMLLISRNYSYMIDRYPEAGGAYAYVKEAFGYDHGFLVAWLLVLTYGTILCASASAIPFFARCFIGDLSRFGHMYTIFGHPVYLGEVLLSAVFIVLAALLCVKRRRLAAGIAAGLVCLMAAAITGYFVVAMTGAGGSIAAAESAAGLAVGPAAGPAADPGKNELLQVILTAAVSPCVFIGIESISHSAEEFTFSRKKSFRILAASVITAAALCVFLLLLSVCAGAFECGSRIMLALAGLVMAGLIGSMLALSRLVFALSRDGVIPARLGKLSKENTPAGAIMLIAGVSIFVPLAGQAVMDWIVDAAVIGGVIACGAVSAAVLKTARQEGDKTAAATGVTGVILMACVLLGLILPGLFSAGSISAKAYLLFALWAILGLLIFRGILKRDGVKRFGQTAAVWIALLMLIFLSCLAWMGTTAMESADTMAQNMHDHLSQSGTGISGEDEGYFLEQMEQMKAASRMRMTIIILVMAAALGTMLSSYTMFSRKVKEDEAELAYARIKANTDALTGVKNKMAYSEAEADLNRHLQRQGGTPFAIAICDLNGLKQVNDTRGHKAGDDYLREASSMICDMFRHSPVFRIGGDEFAVILTNRDFQNREEILARLHRQSAQNIGTGEAVVACGIAVYDPEKDKDVQSVYERADERMYQEKSALKKMGAAER